MKLLWQLMSVYAASRERREKNIFKAEDADDIKEDAGDVEENADDVKEDAADLAEDDYGG